MAPRNCGNELKRPDVGIIALKSYAQTAKQIDKALLYRHKNNIGFDHGDHDLPRSFLIPTNEVRFTNGEGKVVIGESVRGKDIYVLCDIGNYSCTYEMHGYLNHMSPDDHFQDLKRTLSAIGGKSKRTTVIMPLLYASRQDKRRSRESLDCAMALQELEAMGIENIMTFDVHNSAVQNAIPLTSFENLYPTYNIVKALAEDDRDLFDPEKLIVISPDTGAMDRAIYYGSLLKSDVGLFYKRRDYTKVVKGKNPIVAHEYMGRSVDGMNALIVDDIVASGESVFDIIRELHKRHVNNVYIATTFALFTEGIQKFNEYYERGMLSKLYSTNLTYMHPETLSTPWFREVDMSSFIAKLIDTLNYSRSVAPLLDVTTETEKLI